VDTPKRIETMIRKATLSSKRTYSAAMPPTKQLAWYAVLPMMMPIALAGMTAANIADAPRSEPGPKRICIA
jgi:hypothetical protein